MNELTVTATARNWAFDTMTGTGQARDDARPLSALIGEPAPEFELAMLDGSSFKLGDHLGKEVLVLDFWATWCGPCLAAMPEIMAAVEAFEGKGVRLVGINQQEAPAKVKRFLQRRGWDLPVAMDTDRSVRRLYGVQGIPTTFVIGMDGRVSMVHTGYAPGLQAELIEDIKRALK